VVHARADDQRTDPSGNSGDRVLCGQLVSGPASGMAPRP
jgi:Cu-Zn family superoxide dismutase